MPSCRQGQRTGPRPGAPGQGHRRGRCSLCTGCCCSRQDRPMGHLGRAGRPSAPGREACWTGPGSKRRPSVLRAAGPGWGWGWVGCKERGTLGQARRAREHANGEACNGATGGNRTTQPGTSDNEGSTACPIVRKHGLAVTLRAPMLESLCALAYGTACRAVAVLLGSGCAAMQRQAPKRRSRYFCASADGSTCCGTQAPHGVGMALI